MTNKQKFFIEEYLVDFNATRAAIAAGYSEKTAHVQGYQLLSIPEIREQIQNATNERKNNLVADRLERMEFLTEIMRDKSEQTKHRLKACELLSRLQGDFIKQIEVEHKNTTLADILLTLNADTD